jgi:hypothetical protein
LPKITKGSLPARPGFAKTSAAQSIDGTWNGIIFGPYPVPLSRRVE